MCGFFSLSKSFFFVPVACLMRRVVGSAAADLSGMCYAPVDVVQLQDMTSSFDNRWPAMADQIGDVIDSLAAINPNSRFGFATFGDKPLGNDQHSLGYEFDYCLHVDVQISEPSADKMTALFESYTQTAQGGGADWPEAVFEGVQRVLLAPQVGWQIRANTTRIVVVVTDATSHLPGDAAKLVGIDLPENHLTAKALEPNENTLCAEQDYPSLQQIADLVKKMEVSLIFIVAPGGSYGADGRFSPAASLARFGKKYWKEDGLQLWYEDQLAEVGIEAIVQTMDPQMSVYAEAFKTALQKYQAWRCATTTTEPPSESTTAAADTTPGTTAASTEPITSSAVPPAPTMTTAASTTPVTTAASTTEPVTFTAVPPAPTVTTAVSTTEPVTFTAVPPAPTVTTAASTTEPVTFTAVPPAPTVTTAASTTEPVTFTFLPSPPTAPSTTETGSNNWSPCCGNCCEESCGCGFSEIKIDISIIMTPRDGVPQREPLKMAPIRIPANRLLQALN